MVEYKNTDMIGDTDLAKIQDVLEKIDMFRKLIHKTLTKGSDYGIIPGTHKPTLLKPGAEKIQRLLEVDTDFDVIKQIEDYDGGFFAYHIKCRVIKNGKTTTTGLGSCNSREKKYRNQDPCTIQNTCLKMAKKRALVDAIISFASLSDVFTQDIEDIYPLHDKVSTDTSGVITENQAKRMFALSKGNHNLVLEEINKYGYKKSNEVMKIHYDDICKSLEGKAK